MIFRIVNYSQSARCADEPRTEWYELKTLPGNNLGEPEAFSTNRRCPEEGRICSALFLAVYSQPAEEWSTISNVEQRETPMRYVIGSQPQRVVESGYQLLDVHNDLLLLVIRIEVMRPANEMQLQINCWK